jgi:hypothetical protein
MEPQYCIHHRGVSKGKCLGGIDLRTLTFFFPFNKWEIKLLKRTIYNHLRHHHLRRQTLKDYERIQRSNMTTYKILSQKLKTDDFEESKLLICKLILSRPESVPTRYFQYERNLNREFNPIIVSEDLKLRVKNYSFCHHLLLVELRMTEATKTLIDEFIRCADVRNLILTYSYPLFLPSAGCYEEVSELILKDGFKIRTFEPISEKI